MIYAGCDLGMVSAKAVVVRDGDVLAAEVLPYGSRPHEAAARVMERAATRAGLSAGDVDGWVATGFGGKAVPGALDVAPIKMCLHRAIREVNPHVRTVIDVGGHSLTAFNIDGDGRLGASSITDACAAGTGKFVEAMARLLETPLEDFSSAAHRSISPARVTGQCVVLAESDVISHINDGVEPDDILAGIASAVADKIAGMVRRIDVNEEIALVGGVGRNDAVARALEDELRLRLADLGGIAPELVAAFGAALMAGDARRGQSRAGGIRG